MKIIIIIAVVILVAVCIGLYIMALQELKEITEELTETYNNFSDEMELLAETLVVYHELLKDYQIPMIANPTPEMFQVVNGGKEEHW